MMSLPSSIVCPRSLGQLTTGSLHQLVSLRPTSLILVSSPSSIFQIERNGGFIRMSFVSSLSVTQALFARLNFSPAQVHPPQQWQPSQQQQPSWQHQHNHQQPPLLVQLVLLSNLIRCFICNSSVKKFWVVLISPRPLLSSLGLTSVVRAKQNSTITCSRSFLLVAILTYLPLGCLPCLAFRSICKQ